jgi:Tfp pilus assembly protein PilN
VLNQLYPAYVPLLTFLGTLLIVAVGILYNNSRITDFSSRITDVKDLIQAEARVTEANIGRLEEKTDRLEQKIDRVENLLVTRLADHDTRLRRLESR